MTWASEKSSSVSNDEQEVFQALKFESAGREQCQLELLILRNWCCQKSRCLFESRYRTIFLTLRRQAARAHKISIVRRRPPQLLQGHTTSTLFQGGLHHNDLQIILLDHTLIFNVSL